MRFWYLKKSMRTIYMTLGFLLLIEVSSRKMHQELAKKFDSSDRHDIVIEIQGGNSIPLNTIQEDHIYPTRSHKIRHLVATLQEHAETSQYQVHQLLERYSHHHAGDVRTLFITNQIAVRKATRKLVEELEKIPNVHLIFHDERNGEVRKNDDLQHRKLKEVIGGGNDAMLNESIVQTPPTPWGIAKVNVSHVWASGYTGQGIIVGHIDTGIRATHVTIGRERVIAWKDAVNASAEPYDDGFHGTHTAGTAFGKFGIGIVPSADIVSCKALNENNSFTGSEVIECAQFILCPDLGVCEKTPHIVTNSWGYFSSAVSAFQDLAFAWEKSGIIAVFSAGNNFKADSCEDLEIKPPASYQNVIGVGATTINDQLAKFSRQGPSLYDPYQSKPDISAPGNEVPSASYTGDNDYMTISGTSMATPLVAGAIALMIQKGLEMGLDLTYNDIYKILTSTADTNLGAPEFSCTSFDTYPNNAYGYGQLNIGKAFEAVTKMTAPTPTPTMTPTPTPNETTTIPTTIPTPQPTDPVTPSPNETTTIPTPLPTEPIPLPTEPTPLPTAPTPQPTDPVTPSPNETTTIPTPLPTEPTPLPTEPTPLPTAPTPQPTDFVTPSPNETTTIPTPQPTDFVTPSPCPTIQPTPLPTPTPLATSELCD